MKKNMEKDINNMKCDFCNNEATVSIGTSKAFNMCDDCLKEALSYLKEKKDECKVCDENYTCPQCMGECNECEELEIEDDDMF